MNIWHIYIPTYSSYKVGTYIVKQSGNERNELDLCDIDKFVRVVKQKIVSYGQEDIEVPGQRPYKEWNGHIIPIVFEVCIVEYMQNYVR